jgi:hypothetical protein
MGITVILHFHLLYTRPIRWQHVSPPVGPPSSAPPGPSALLTPPRSSLVCSLDDLRQRECLRPSPRVLFLPSCQRLKDMEVNTCGGHHEWCCQRCLGHVASGLRPPRFLWCLMHAMVLRGAFNARPPARIPNSSPSSARFMESTPMSRSCDLFHEGPRKRHPRTLGFDDVIRDLRWLAAALEGSSTGSLQ